MFRRLTTAALLLLGGCAAQLPDISAGPDPANSAMVSGLPRQPAVTAGNGVQFPVNGGDWEAANRCVAPGAGRSP